MHFHNPIHKKGYTPPNKEYPFRYMSMTHARGLRIGRLNLNKTQFKKFYTRYKKTLPSTVDCVKHAEAIVNSII